MQLIILFLHITQLLFQQGGTTFGGGVVLVISLHLSEHSDLVFEPMVLGLELLHFPE